MVKKCVSWYRLALVALLISALSLMCVPLVQEQDVFQYILAGTFWVSLLTELILLGMSNSTRKKIEKMSPQMKQEWPAGKIGLFSFAQNRKAAVADIMLLASVGYVATMNFVSVDNEWLVLAGLVAVYVFFHLHCILNSALYKSINHYIKLINKRSERK